MNAQVPAVIEGAARAGLMAGTAPRPIVPESLDQVWRFAQLIAKSGMAPSSFKTPEAITVAIMHGLEVGLTPFAALQSIAVVNGRPTIWGDGALGLVRGSGLCEWVKETISGEGDALTATCRAKRKGDPEAAIGVFGVADAKRAGLWGKAGPWQQYPRRMLAMRARAFALRDGFADVLRGVGIREEQEDVERTPAPGPRRAEIMRPPARSAPPEPPAEDPAVVVEAEPQDAKDWLRDLAAYRDALSGCEAGEELQEVIEVHGSIFADAPEEIRAGAKQAEDERRDAIGEEGPPAPAADPAAEVYQRMHELISDGLSYMAARNRLDPDPLKLLSKEQESALKQLAGGAK